MSSTRYIRQDGENGAVSFTPDPHAIALSEHARRQHVASALYRQLTDYHRAVTGPRQAIGSDLTHNAVEAARHVLDTLTVVDAELAETFRARYGTPYRWQYGPRVNGAGFTVSGLYNTEDHPRVSPPAYRPPGSGPAPEHLRTERDRILADVLYKHLLALSCAGLTATVERECPSCRLTLRATHNDREWRHLGGEDADPCPFTPAESA